MDVILDLKKQIEKVILLLEHQLIDDPDRPILKTLYELSLIHILIRTAKEILGEKICNIALFNVTDEPYKMFSIKSVSYTHLDVYKRQEKAMIIDDTTQLLL